MVSETVVVVVDVYVDGAVAVAVAAVNVVSWKCVLILETCGFDNVASCYLVERIETGSRERDKESSFHQYGYDDVEQGGR
jgi:hypothetical protein